MELIAIDGMKMGNSVDTENVIVNGIKTQDSVH